MNIVKMAPPHERGMMDSYYGRNRAPHYYAYNPDLPGKFRVEEANMTPEEIKAYHEGYDENERLGDKKDWG